MIGIASSDPGTNEVAEFAGLASPPLHADLMLETTGIYSRWICWFSAPPKNRGFEPRNLNLLGPSDKLRSRMEKNREITRVFRSKREAIKFYSRIAWCYDWAGFFERKAAAEALRHLNIQQREKVLEIGFGTGYCLQQIAKPAANRGDVIGLDISEGMIRKTMERLGRASLLDKSELVVSDACRLPFGDQIFDAVFSSFTLELFDTPEIPVVLGEVRRVLKPGGRLGVVSLSRPAEGSFAVAAYEWVHRKLPIYVDCRPIYVENSLREAGFDIVQKKNGHLAVLPLETVVAAKRS